MGPRPALGAGGDPLGRAARDARLWLWAGLLGSGLLGSRLLVGTLGRPRPWFRSRLLVARVSRLPRRLSWRLARRRRAFPRRGSRPTLTPFAAPAFAGSMRETPLGEIRPQMPHRILLCRTLHPAGMAVLKARDD